MISTDQASYLINQIFHDIPSGVEDLDLLKISDATLAQDLVADRDYPPFDRVMMDGIAVNFSSLQDGINKFEICEIVSAGMKGSRINSPTDCVEIMTGAMLVENANVVIPYEHLNIEGKFATLINSPTIYKKFDNIHLQGSDVKAGEIILNQKNDLRPTHVAIAASIGADKIKIARSFKIAVVSTGDELVEIDQNPEQYQIRKSNIYAIASALRIFGHTNVKLFHLKDNKDEIEAFMNQNSENFDVMFFSGGVSKGKYDYLPDIWTKLNIEQIFHGVAQRPGKPLWFGKKIDSNLVVYGLPGNPISSLVCLYKYFLNREKNYWGRLTQKIEFNKNLTYFVPVRVNFSTNGYMELIPEIVKNSGEFTGLAETDGFIELAAEKSEFNEGEIVRFYPWKNWK